MKKTVLYLMIAAMCLIPVAVSAGDTLTASHTAVAKGSEVVVTNTVNYTGQLTAVGLKATLPEGWSFVSVGGNNVPAISPKAGTAGVLEFVWIQPPQSPFTFTYTVSGDQGGNIAAEVLYRRDAGELNVKVLPESLTVK